MPEAPPVESNALRAAVGILAVEATALAVALGFLLYEDARGAVATVQTAVAVTLYAAVMAGAVGGLAWALGRRRAWARGPAIVAQLFLAFNGYAMLTSGAPVLGAPTLVLAVVGLGVLVSPSIRAALGRD